MFLIIVFPPSSYLGPGRTPCGTSEKEARKYRRKGSFGCTCSVYRKKMEINVHGHRDIR